MSELSFFKTYWTIYGGYKAVLNSWFASISLMLTVFLFPLWMIGSKGQALWTSLAIAIVPGLLGFSLGALAIMLAFSNEKLMKAILENGREDSFFMLAATAIFHFIVVQTLALITSFFTMAFPHFLLSFFGFFLLVYGLFCAVAAAGALLDVAEILNTTARPRAQQIENE